MKEKLKEIFLGIFYGIVTMLFMIGLLPADLVSKIFGCIVAMLAIYRIRKKMEEGQKPVSFTVSYVFVIILSTILINSLLSGT